MAIRNKIVLTGSLGNPGVEEWSIGVHYGGLGSGNLQTSAELQDWAEDAFAIFTDFVTYPTWGGALSDSVTLSTVTAYYYPAVGPALGVGASSAPPVPGLTTADLPPQCSVVASLLTGLSGRSFRGRVYLPLLSMAFNADTFQIDAGQQQGVADDFAGMLTAIGNAGSGVQLITPVVYSAARDLITPVSQISVGSVIDTQRRRREGLAESYLSADVG